MGYAGQISLGHAAFYGIGAYTSAILTVKLSVSPWLAMRAWRAHHRHHRLSHRHPHLPAAAEHYLAMATLGLGIIVFLAFGEFRRIDRRPDPACPASRG